MAVSIWEGSKAQNLIDAVEKGGLSEGVKNALLDIAQNVVYQNQNGSTYYNNLYNALYPAPEPPEPVDPSLIFHLDAPVSIRQGTDIIDTDIAFGSTNTFTVLVDAELDADTSATQRRILHGINSLSTNPDQYNGISVMMFTYSGTQKLTCDLNTSESGDVNYNQLSAHRVRYAGRYDSSTKEYRAILYIDNNKVVDSTKTITILGDATRTAKLGGQISGETYSNILLGDVNLCNIYDRYLTDEEVQTIMGISL